MVRLRAGRAGFFNARSLSSDPRRLGTEALRCITIRGLGFQGCLRGRVSLLDQGKTNMSVRQLATVSLLKFLPLRIQVLKKGIFFLTFLLLQFYPSILLVGCHLIWEEDSHSPADQLLLNYLTRAYVSSSSAAIQAMSARVGTGGTSFRHKSEILGRVYKKTMHHLTTP